MKFPSLRRVSGAVLLLLPAPAYAFQPCPAGTHPSQVWPVALYILGVLIGLGGGSWFIFRATRAPSGPRRAVWIAAVVAALALGLTCVMGGGFVNAIVRCVAD